MEKGPDAFRTISEVADELDLPQHVLRFWETRFSQIKPMKRGGGRRYYRPTDVDMLRGVKHLLYEEGYTIKGVQKLLRENGVQFAVAIGSGDMTAFEEMARKNAELARASEAASAGAAQIALEADGNVLVGEPKARSRGIFGLGHSGEDADDTNGAQPITRENRALLQETLFDLLECKRLLDQAR
ncbi:MerR family transcriptional regulator [Oricola sp.]|uniref:MerR family transcriptional regulator n=1 Tax=Oricola sp. TaxID=1979950 RepID=UPI003BA87AC6